jgi:phosphatidate cytidylyltransferase
MDSENAATAPSGNSDYEAPSEIPQVGRGYPGETIDHQPASPEKRRWKGLAPRTISALVMAAVAGGALWAGGWIFTLLVFVAGVQMWLEWRRMAISAKWDAEWHAVGMLYVFIPCLAFVYLRNYALPHGFPPQHSYFNLYLCLYIVGLVIATDVGAYFAGRLIGGPKLAPSISPNKTWAGSVGGLFSAYAAQVFFRWFFFGEHYFLYPWDILLPLLISSLAQIGDLFESWVKRRAGVKDSGNLIPGHGGLLDRMDGYMFIVPAIALIIYMFNLIWMNFTWQ